MSAALSPGTRRRPATAGFTLLEVMVALAILGTGVAAVLGLLAQGASMTQRTRARLLATELAQERMEALFLDDAATNGAGRFAPPHEDFRWRSRVSAGPVDASRLLEVTVVGGGDSVHLATVRVP